MRYTAVRRQTAAKPGERELQVLDYQNTAHALLPLLSTAYALIFMVGWPCSPMICLCACTSLHGPGSIMSWAWPCSLWKPRPGMQAGSPMHQNGVHLIEGCRMYSCQVHMAVAATPQQVRLCTHGRPHICTMACRCSCIHAGATACVLVSQGKKAMQRYHDFEAARSNGDFSILPELHSMLSGMKVSPCQLSTVV